MLSRIRTRLTFANVISLIALFITLGGSVYAATKINGTRIKKHSEPGNRLKDDTVTGRQVEERSLRAVKKAGVANAAVSTFHDAAINIPDSSGTIGTLNVPKAGAYVISAKLVAFDSTANNVTSGRCTLQAGADVDTVDFDVTGSSTDDTEMVALQLAHTFGSPGSVVLACQDGTASATGQALNTRITAVQVRSLSNVEF